MQKISDIQKYDLEGDWDEVIFTLHNPTGVDVFFDLFSPMVSYQANIPSAPPTFYIDGSSGYNTSVRDFFNAPAWVRRIYIYSKNEQNFNQIITHVYKDANGNEVNIPRIPNISVGINQFQGWIGQLDFLNYETVFGINQWYQRVLIKAFSDISFLLIYKQIDKYKILTTLGNLNPNILGENFEGCLNNVRKWSERDLALYDNSVVSLYKQNMFSGDVRSAVVPFNAYFMDNINQKR